MNVKTVFLAIFCCLSLFPNLLRAQEADLFNYENSLKFAIHLSDIHKYEASAQEYERVLFFSPGNPLVQESLINTYFLARKYSTGAERARALYTSIDSMPGNIAFSYGKNLLLNQSHPELSMLLQKNNHILKEDKHLLELGQAVFTQDWKEAQETYHTFIATESRMDIFSPIILKTERIKRKKPLLAVGLSSLVPGLGRFYTKQWKDGIISFVITGSLGYASFRHFNRNGSSSVLGWVYGGLALGFYTGNLYGSIQSAHRYNEQESGKIIDETARLVYRHF